MAQNTASPTEQDYCTLAQETTLLDATSCKTYFETYHTKLQNRLNQIVASRDERFTVEKQQELIDAITQKIQQKRAVTTNKATYAALSYLQLFFSQIEISDSGKDDITGRPATGDNEEQSTEAKIRTSSYPLHYTEQKETLSFGQEAPVFIASLDIRADLEPLTLESLKIHHQTLPGQVMSQGIEKFVLYAPDGVTPIAEATVPTEGNYTILDHIGHTLPGGEFRFEKQVTLYLAAVPRKTDYLEDIQALRDAKVAFSTIEVTNGRGNTITSQTTMTERSAGFSVVLQDVTRPMLVDEVQIGGQQVKVDEHLHNGKTNLAIMALPVEGGTDDYKFLIRTLQPQISASAGITMTDIVIERIGGTYDNDFAYADLALVSSSNPADYTNGADPVNLVVQPSTVAYFLLRAELSGVTDTETIKITFDESTLRFSTNKRLGTTFVGDIITPEQFSTETMLYGR